MPRAKLHMPEQYQFSTELDVRITDLNYANHLGNDSLLSLLHEARLRFLNHYGYSEINVDGAGIMMADVVIIYKAQGFYADKLIIDMAIGDIAKKSCDLYYQVRKSDHKIVAQCKTALVFFDFQSQKPVRIPEGFLKKLVRQTRQD